MDFYQNQIIQFINNSINECQININKKENIDWTNIINLSRQYKIEAIVYFAIPDNIKNTIPNNLLNLIKKEAFISGLTQQRYMKNIENLLLEFNKQYIDVLMLNDISTRDLYLNQLFRTISEGNLFVMKEDLDKAKEILDNKGYSLYEETEFSTLYTRNRCLPIRLQWGFEKDLNNEHLLKFNQDICEDINHISIGKAYAYEMYLEDLILFKCINMAKDIYKEGVDLRELIDFTLLVNKRSREVNWMRFMNRCKKYRIYRLVTQIMITCNKLFKMQIPREIEYIMHGDKTFLDLFIKDIFGDDYHSEEGIIETKSGELAYKCEKINIKKDNVFKKSIKATFIKIIDAAEEYGNAK